MHENIFKTKTKEELLELYGEFLELEERIRILENPESKLGKIKSEYEKEYFTDALLVMQIELTHTIADLWYKENKQNNHKIDFSYGNKR